MIKEELKAISKKKFYILVMVALMLIPAMYNFIFLGSMWNPYGELKNLPVAVVNLDKASKLNDSTLRLGDELVKELKTTKDLDYSFVSEKEASSGITNGKYYMKITFPEDFSANTASLMTKSPQKVVIDYQTSRGHNYISSKMSESAMERLKNGVSENITEQYTKAIFSKLTSLKSGMKEATSGASQLSTGSNQLNSGMKVLSASVLNFSNGVDSLKIGLDQYLTGVATANS
ncbi:MAG: YhgE/Pip family protein, partial [Streptococcaceae bacterium]|nr:YhgE/Pip family protein [Streptococcaceae bacterium]